MAAGPKADPGCDRKAMRRAASATAVKVSLSLLGFGVLWIVTTDRLAAAVAHSAADYQAFQTVKGVLYITLSVILTAVIVYRLSFAQLDHKHARRKAELEVIERLAIASEWRDDETGDHVRRVAESAAVISRKYGLCPEACHRVRIAAAMHDIGKIGVADEIVKFQGRYNAEQRAQMSAHTLIGAQILRRAESPLLQTARNVALSHHERWDGKGYPEGLRGEEIPIEARITAVADVLDALYNRRRYKDAWPWEIAVQEIVDGAGTHFDPRVVEAFVAGSVEIKKIYDAALVCPEDEVRRQQSEYDWLTAREVA
jgi:putative two-component system response regulator